MAFLAKCVTLLNVVRHSVCAGDTSLEIGISTTTLVCTMVLALPMNGSLPLRVEDFIVYALASIGGPYPRLSYHQQQSRILEHPARATELAHVSLQKDRSGSSWLWPTLASSSIAALPRSRNLMAWP